MISIDILKGRFVLKRSINAKDYQKERSLALIGDLANYICCKLKKMPSYAIKKLAE